MRQFHTAVLDTFCDLENGYTTEPYEAAWAGEATFFIRTEEAKPNATTARMKVEISPDGMTWVEEGGVLELDRAKTLSFVRVTHFGGWLRLRHTDGSTDGFQATVYLVLKE